ncbi:mycofactocin biosynthesis chaperone MftB, partial [Gordonia jinghuaiqii]|nr:mycofactocin biosynthesis chaperone MftB [Gordonia jinghuaiqii]
MSAPTSNPISGDRSAVAGVRFDTLDAWSLNPKVALRPEP